MKFYFAAFLRAETFIFVNQMERCLKSILSLFLFQIILLMQKYTQYQSLQMLIEEELSKDYAGALHDLL